MTRETNARINQLSVRLSMLLVAFVVTFLLVGGAGADAGTPPVPAQQYVVEGGDTLWAVAAKHTAPGGDVRVVISRIMEATGLGNSSLRPGQVLLIPQA
jgi:LysM repeat protein